MNKIYIITAGCYSDYHICAAFSTKEKAEEYVTLWGEDAGIEGFDVDKIPNHPHGMRAWMVSTKNNGEVGYAYMMNVGGPDGWRSVFDGSGDGDLMEDGGTFYMWARDKEHAIKIASERRAMAIAENRLKFGKTINEIKGNATLIAGCCFSETE